MEEIEIWKDIPWYENSHQVSSFWNIRTKSRMVVSWRYWMRLCKAMPLKPTLDGWYFRIQFNSNWKIFWVHRLVCAAFLWLDLNDKKQFACHIDDNPSNNRLDNLFVGDAQDNVDDKIRKWRAVYVRWVEQWNNKLTEEDIRDIFRMREDWLTQLRIANIKWICQPHVSDILKRNRWGYLEI